VKLQDAMTSGIVLGISALLARVALGDAVVGIYAPVLIFMNPLSWLSLFIGAIGFVYLQKALHQEKISYVAPLVSSLSIITPVILSVVFFHEGVPVMRWLGIWLILVGVIGISHGDWEEGLIAGFIKHFRGEK